MHMEQLKINIALCILLFFIIGITPSPTPEASLTCISECGTCPLICSPPPSMESKPQPSAEPKPPPSVQPKPPKPPKEGDSEPPPYLTPIYQTTPPQSYFPPTPTQSYSPPPRPRAKSCPPPSTVSLGTNAPPPPPKLVVVPSTQLPPNDGTGQNNNSYPYYYFYTSEGVVLSKENIDLMLIPCFYFIFLFIG